MSFVPPASHIVHSSFGHEVLREINSLDAKVTPANLMLPIFVTNSNPDAVEEIGSLPGVKRYGINEIVNFLTPLVQKGLRTVLLFGVDVKSQKVFMWILFDRNLIFWHNFPVNIFFIEA